MKRYFYLFIFSIISVAIFAQSNLPKCQENSIWNACFGSRVYGDGDKYIGEFKDDLFGGRGTVFYSDGRKYEGEFKNNMLHGKGIFTFVDGSKFVGEYVRGIREGQGAYFYPTGNIWLGEWSGGKPHGRFIKYKADKTIDASGLFENGKLISPQILTPSVFSRVSISSELGMGSSKVEVAVGLEKNNDIQRAQLELDQERKFLIEERRKLEADKNIRAQPNSSSPINIQASATQPDLNGVVTLNIKTNADTSSLKINGDELGGKSDGIYSVEKIARIGQETKFTIVGADINGNTDTKSIIVFRQVAESIARTEQLNVATIKQRPFNEAVAIIIGIEKYKNVSKADFANSDARDFYDYAARALGIRPENIKILVDDEADDISILKAFQEWLPLQVKRGSTDVYIFFSGHGYPSDDGKGLYLLPFGVNKNYMYRTAVKQEELTAALQIAKPRSVTMFIDSCYSGQTRSGEMLVTGIRPIGLKTTESVYPPDFTVITASAFDQVSSSNQDLKHGIFSFYLMKGMEGDADINKDGRITAREMHDYLTDMIGKKALGMNKKQQPQLFGNPERVLVSR